MGAAYCCLPRTVALWVDHTIKPHSSVPQKSQQPYTTRTFSVAAKPTKPGAVVGICQPPPPSSQLGEGQLVKESDPTTAGMGNAGKAMTHSCSLSANPITSKGWKHLFSIKKGCLANPDWRQPYVERGGGGVVCCLSALTQIPRIY